MQLGAGRSGHRFAALAVKVVTAPIHTNDRQLKRAVVNMGSGVIGYLLPIAATVVSAPILLRELGEEAFGLQSLVSVVIGYLALMDMGMDLPIVKLIAEDRARGRWGTVYATISSTLQIYVSIGVIGGALIYLSATFLSCHVFDVSPSMQQSAVAVFKMAGAGFLGSMGMSWGRAVAIGVQRMDICFGVSALANVAGVFGGLYSVRAGMGIEGYVAARVIASLISGPVYWMLLRKSFPGQRLTLGIDITVIARAKVFMGYGLINRAISSAASRIDQTLIGAWVGVAAAGVYAVPFLVVTSISSMVNAGMGFLFPMAAELGALQQTDALRVVFISSLRIVVFVCGTLFLPLIIFAGPILRLWVPSIADEAISVLRALACGGFISTVCTVPVHGIVLGLGAMRRFTAYTVAHHVCLAIGCLILIPSFGVYGAAVAFLLAAVSDGVYLLITARALMRLGIGPMLRHIVAPTALSLVAGVCAWPMRNFACSWIALILSVALYQTAYLALSLVSGIISRAERQLIVRSCGAITARLGFGKTAA